MKIKICIDNTIYYCNMRKEDNGKYICIYQKECEKQVIEEVEGDTD